MGKTCRPAHPCIALCLALTQPLPAAAVDLADRIQSCARIVGNAQRLACFDELAAEPATFPMGAAAASVATTVPSAVSSGAASPPDIIADKEASFGMEQKLLRQWQAGPGTVSEIRAAVRKLGTGPNGWLIIELDNGQTWAQAEAPQFQILLGVDDEVTIRRAALGSFILSTADNRSMRVRRKN